MTSDRETAEQINILFVSATVPYPATDGGRIRVLNLIRRLCRIHKVTLLASITSPVDEQGAGYLREVGVEVVEVRMLDAGCWNRVSSIKHPASRILRSLLQSFVKGKPLTVAKYYSIEMVRALENLMKSRRFDVIHFEMLHTGQFLLDIVDRSMVRSRGKVRTVLGEQNIDSNIWYRLARAEPNPLRKLIFYWQYRSFLSYESRICRHFNLCICVSPQDGKKLASLCPGTAIEVVPNGVDPDYFKPGEAVEHAASVFEEDETRLVFTGSMDWHPNEDAVLYFCDRIFPLMRAELPEITFYIVGSNPTGRVMKLRGIQGVVVTGSVEDVRPYIASAAVYIVPLRIGSGTRLKILQALAMKKAVVSTSIGCEGLDLQPDKHLIVADEPRQFAAGAVQLIRNRSLRRRLGENGRTLIQERYDWNVIVRKLDNVYRDLICDLEQ